MPKLRRERDRSRVPDNAQRLAGQGGTKSQTNPPGAGRAFVASEHDGGEAREVSEDDGK